MTEETLFQKNVRRWALLCPEEAKRVSELKPHRLKLVTDESGAFNLEGEIGGAVRSFYGLEGGREEAENCISQLDLFEKDVLCVFGIGLGYFYPAIKDWLAKDPGRFLIFFERDLEVIARFFETELAEQMLLDRQVRLYHLEDGNRFEILMDHVGGLFVYRRFAFSALPLYIELFPHVYSSIQSSITFYNSFKSDSAGEILSGGKHYYSNFYPNWYFLPTAYRANALYGKFAGIPAIICGAGPSLDKNLALLETLGDRALIFAGGTALNAVDSSGFWPHFGAGIDPNETHLYRLMMNQAYEVPFFYRNRMYHPACQEINGDRLYVTGSGGYEVAKWFETQMKIDGLDVDEGLNVVNFSFSIAEAMGCNPIILVGVDLAYSNNKSYQSGVINHPLHSFKQEFRTKGASEELLFAKDINGEPIYTLWKWVRESRWYGLMAGKFPATTVLNATEGGLPFPGVPNVTLKQVINTLLDKQMDLAGRVHAEIQNGEMPKEITEGEIEQLFEKFKTSLLACQEQCKGLIEEYAEAIKRLLADGDVPEDFQTEKVIACLDKLKKEDAYLYLLKLSESSFQGVNHLERQLLELEKKAENHAPEKDLRVQEAVLHIRNYDFLYKTATVNLECLGSAERIHALLEARAPTEMDKKPQPVNPGLPTLDYCEGDCYRFEDGKYILIDRELGIEFRRGEGDSPERVSESYPDGTKKMECFYLDGLHGPSTFYSNEGQILSKSWFIHGKQEGKALYFYRSGVLKSAQRYLGGVRHGVQEYYYRDGRLKTRLNYCNGKLNGVVSLYFPDGTLKREIPFSEGKRHGIERKWDEAGRLRIQVQYSHNAPVGSALAWYGNGKPGQEVIYDEASQVVSEQRWDDSGRELSKSLFQKEDYFDRVTKRTGTLTTSLQSVVEQVGMMIPLLRSTESAKTDIAKNFASIQKDLERLQQLGNELFHESGLDIAKMEETIWKTPQSQQIIGRKLDEVTKEMTDKIKMMDELLEKAKPKNPKDDKQC